MGARPRAAIFCFWTVTQRGGNFPRCFPAISPPAAASLGIFIKGLAGATSSVIRD
jgi:hypothetical protein